MRSNQQDDLSNFIKIYNPHANEYQYTFLYHQQINSETLTILSKTDGKPLIKIRNNNGPNDESPEIGTHE